MTHKRNTRGVDLESHGALLDGELGLSEDLALRAAGNLRRLVADPDEQALFAAMLGLPAATIRDETTVDGGRIATGHDQDTES